MSEEIKKEYKLNLTDRQWALLCTCVEFSQRMLSRAEHIFSVHTASELHDLIEELGKSDLD